MKANVHYSRMRDGAMELIAVVRLSPDDRRDIDDARDRTGEPAEASVCTRYVSRLIQRHTPGLPDGGRLARALRVLLDGFPPADPARGPLAENDAALLASINRAETPEFLRALGAEARAALDEWVWHFGPLDGADSAVRCPECGDPTGVEVVPRRVLVLCGCELPEHVLAAIAAAAAEG